MRYLGHGRFEDVDGHIHEYEPDPLPLCSACEQEVATCGDLCDLCDEDRPRKPAVVLPPAELEERARPRRERVAALNARAAELQAELRRGAA